MQQSNSVIQSSNPAEHYRHFVRYVIVNETTTTTTPDNFAGISEDNEDEDNDDIMSIPSIS